MKLHLPIGLRRALLAVLALLSPATISSTVATATLTTAAMSAIASQASAEEIYLETTDYTLDTETLSAELIDIYADESIEISNSSLKSTGTDMADVFLTVGSEDGTMNISNSSLVTADGDYNMVNLTAANLTMTNVEVSASEVEISATSGNEKERSKLHRAPMLQ